MCPPHSLTVKFRVPNLHSLESTRADGYENGTTYENYIDIAGEDYCIYFFDTENKFIAQFEPLLATATEGKNYTEYNIQGETPEALRSHQDFKVVVAANWGKTFYTTSISTLDELYQAQTFDISGLTIANLGPGKRLIPFYGVHQYQNVEYKPNIPTVLSDPVSLIRAVAKVEILLEKDPIIDYKFSSVKIHNYNSQGYCAPNNIDSEEKYIHGKWEDDYIRALNIPDNQKKTETIDLPLISEDYSEGEKKYRLYAGYLPEYDNKDEDFSYIEAMFDFQLEGAEANKIYFAKYTDGKTDNAVDKRYNIERNNLYRFKVKYDSYKLELFVSNWFGWYDNNFEFGDGQVATPISPWDDEITNDADFNLE